MAFADQYTNGNSLVFTQRVSIAMENAAIAISSEATSTTNHGNRVALAKQTLLNPSQYAPLFAQAVAANLAMDAPNSATDAQLSNTVSAIWNALAGVP